MYSICVFAGTTEGRRLCDFLRGQEAAVLACVATEYGEAMIPAGENVEVAAGRLDEPAMEALFARRRFDVVVDATHPFAVEASGNIEAACRAADTEYLRLNRGGVDTDGAVSVDSIEGAAAFLANHPGNALVTTGGKNLEPYAAVPGFQDRIWVRVLPVAASLRACEQAGFAPSHVIAMQGPFSREMNAATLRAIRADWLVTKDSGDVGGLGEKLAAARDAGAGCVVVGRPEQRDGLDFAGVVARLTERFGLKDVRNIDLVGIGMGGGGTLTREAREALERADCVIGAARMLEAVERFGKPACEEYRPDAIAAFIAGHPEYRRLAVVLSGDPGFHSGAKKLLARLSGHRVRVIPGISSVQYLCARIGASWDDAALVSMHGQEASVAPVLKKRGKVFALTEGQRSLRAVCRELMDAGMEDAVIHVGQRLSYPDENIVSGGPRELMNMDCDPLTALLIERAPERAPMAVGLPDEGFIREERAGGRPIPMTKSEVRAVSLSKLRLTEDAVVWDVGAGTGSVTVETALLCPHGRVYAVEKDGDACDLIARNAAKQAASNVEIVRGEAPAALACLPAPTHVFIGGSGGGLGPIVDAALAANPAARIVVNAVTPESVGRIAGIMGRFREAELVQLSVSRARGAGRVHLMEGLNPVWIAAMQFPKEAGE